MIKRGVNEDILEEQYDDEEEQKESGSQNHYGEDEYVDRLGQDEEGDEDAAVAYNWRRAD